MKISDFVLGTLALFMIVHLYMHLTLTKEVRQTEKYCYSQMAQDSAFKANVKKKLISLDQKDSVIAETIVYLDSCNQAKQSKVEKAEKRGRFIGGLLRGLFPGI
jgi:hypothetical protein